MATSTGTDSPDIPASELEITVEEGAGSTRHLTVEIPADRVERIRERERKQLGSSLNLDGFRPGKVPARVVEERYGEVVDERVRRTGVEEGVRQALRDAEIQPVSQPEVRNVRYQRGGDLVFEAEVEVAPTLELERIGGFRIEEPSTEVSDEDVEEVLTRLREDEAVWEPVTRAPADGDQVAVRILPLDEEGEPDPADEEEKEPYRFELGEGYAIPDVEDAIRTLEPGETDDFDVRFPDDFDNETLAGTDRRLRIELLEVKEKGLPPLDDEFASRIGDFESVEELRGAVVEDLEQHRREEADEAVRRSLLDSIIEANPFEVPEAMVDRYLDRVIDAPEDVDPEQLQEARKEFYPRAEQEVKRQMVVDHLMEREGYEATDEELEERIREIAGRREMEPDELRRQLARQQQLEGVRRHIATEKLFDRLREESEVR